MRRLVLGPLLRHVGATDATVWVETDTPCTVEVLGSRARTWEAGGHHYALVCVSGLEPGRATAYEVRLDDTVVWPPPDSRYPPSLVRTLSAASRPLRVLFGSCRFATPATVSGGAAFDADALDAYAKRLADLPTEQWPDLLLLLGDQVYADETSDGVAQRIGGRRDVRLPPGREVADFEEYTWLYQESWTDPDVRWLLSTVPSSMIFDDHDIADDWNTSAAWRRQVQASSWWQERVVGGLSSYWVYQHIGNLSPQALAADETYQRVLGADGDVLPMLREFAAAADREADGRKGAQWSYRRDLGEVRLVVVDSRAGRLLDGGERSMVSRDEFAWITDQVRGDYSHLLVGTSLPWLLSRAMHDVEAWNELLASGARGARVARWSERLRQGADLEHWAAFRSSFEALATLLGDVGRGAYAGSGGPPASVCVLSGDVHHAYAARAHYDDSVQSPVWQLTCSPVHNRVPRAMRWAFRLSWSRAVERLTRLVLDRVVRVPRPSLSWSRALGPSYGNEIATLTLDGREARLLLERAGLERDGPALERVADLGLT